MRGPGTALTHTSNGEIRLGFTKDPLDLNSNADNPTLQDRLDIAQQRYNHSLVIDIRTSARPIREHDHARSFTIAP
jgi:hypothetical protein